MEGLIEWRKIGLAPPECVSQSTKNYRNDNDTIGQWKESACICESGRRTSMKELYESYKFWCENSSLDALPNTAFGKELTRLGYKTVKTKKGNDRMGIGLKEPPGMTGGVAGKLPMSLNAQVMRSKRHEVGSELKH
jgi:putative DNA primase/helicase